MGIYRYKAINQDGVLKKGVIEAETLDTVHDDLSRQGLNVLSVKQSSKLSFSLAGLFKKKAKRKDIIELSNNLSVIMRAGIPLLDALEDISQSVENKHLKAAIDDIRERIRTGIGFSEALSYHKDVFPDVFVRLVTVGEETGRLEQSITDISAHLQRMEDLSALMARAFIYPVILLVLAFAMMIFWLAWVLPKVVSLLKDLNTALPPLTLGLIALADWTKQYWYWIIIAAAALFIFFRILSKKESLHYYFDHIKLKLPLVKLFVSNGLLSTLTEQLRILVISGITIDRSMNIAAIAIGSEVFKKALLTAKDKVMTGSRVSEALKEHDIFPRLVIRMVDIGESSGSLDHQFAFLSNYYYKQLEDVTAKFGKIIEPALIIVVAIIYIIVLVAVFVPIYDGIKTVR